MTRLRRFVWHLFAFWYATGEAYKLAKLYPVWYAEAEATLRGIRRATRRLGYYPCQHCHKMHRDPTGDLSVSSWGA